MKITIYNDLAEHFQLNFQDSASDIMFSIWELHNIINFYLLIILILITWILLKFIYRFNYKKNIINYKYLNHDTALELLWTLSPAVLLIIFAIPSFKLLYSTEDIIDPLITLKINARQWYWNAEYSDYFDNDINFDIYLIPTEDLTDGQIRLLEVDNRIILPINTQIRSIITSSDVIHSFGIPSLGIKIDAIPGRLNQTSFEINRTGVFYGNCYELCGILHGYMPIVIEGVKLEEYLEWLNKQ